MRLAGYLGLGRDRVDAFSILTDADWYAQSAAGAIERPTAAESRIRSHPRHACPGRRPRRADTCFIGGDPVLVLHPLLEAHAPYALTRHRRANPDQGEC